MSTTNTLSASVAGRNPTIRKSSGSSSGSSRRCLENDIENEYDNDDQEVDIFSFVTRDWRKSSVVDY